MSTISPKCSSYNSITYHTILVYLTELVTVYPVLRILHDHYKNLAVDTAPDYYVYGMSFTILRYK